MLQADIRLGQHDEILAIARMHIPVMPNPNINSAAQLHAVTALVKGLTQKGSAVTP